MTENWNPPTPEPQNSPQPEPQPQARPLPAKKKGLSPLALVLILSGAFFAIFMVVSGILFLSRSPSGSAKPAGSALFKSGGAVAIIEVNGAIMDSKKTLRRIERVEDDGDIKAVVLRINSPGGAVAPSQEIYEAVRKLKKPVVASMGSIAASGGFYIAMGAKKVYANPGTITGSIGVIMQFANLEKLYDWAKIRRYVIKTGRFKDVGAEYREMGDDERKLLQGMVDEVLSQFKRAVAEGRKLPMEQVTAVADGRILSGSQAKAAKLVDELGTLQDAINEAGKMAGLEGKPRVVYPEKKALRWFELLLQEPSREESDAESAFAGRGALARLVSAVLSLGTVEADAETAFSPGIYWLWNGSR